MAKSNWKALTIIVCVFIIVGAAHVENPARDEAQGEGETGGKGSGMEIHAVHFILLRRAEAMDGQTQGFCIEKENNGASACQ